MKCGLEASILDKDAFIKKNRHAQHIQQFQRLQVSAYTRVNIGSMHYLGHMKEPIQSSTR